MPQPTITTVRIEENLHEAGLSPAQKKFNQLIEKIEAQKTLLAAWQEAIPQFQQEITQKLLPLRHTFREHQAEMVAMLDGLYTHEKFSTMQYEKISYLISSLCEELIHHGWDDLKPLYDYHSGQDTDQTDFDDEAMLKSFLEQNSGVDLGDDECDFSDAAVEKKHSDEESRGKRKKSDRQLRKEANEKEEETTISKMIQAVYRQLVAALHPDREPDPAERERKTELMKKVTVAYGKKDLAQLLELQFSIAQIDQHAVRHIADDRLKYYNTMLQRQLEDFWQEVQHVEQHVREMLGLSWHDPLSPKRLFTFLNEDTRSLRSQINRIQQDLMLFHDVRQFKLWLKGYRIPQSELDRFF